MADTVAQLLSERAGDAGLAIRSEAGDWTWPQYLAAARRTAKEVLSHTDSTRPMHVGTLLGNTPTMLIALAAGALGGYVTVGVNDTRRGESLVADLRRADCQVLLVDDEHRAMLDGLDLAGITVLDTSSPEWAARLAPEGDDVVLVPHVEPTAMDPYMLIFTSGTSGDPKPVRFAHMMIPFAGPRLVERFEVTADDVCYLSMPLFHSAALMGGYCVALCSGATMVPARFSASTFLPDVRRFGVTYMNYVGKPLAYILATPEQPDDADTTLRAAFGNEAADRDIEEFGRRFGCDVWDGFGSTELAIIITREPGTPAGSIGKGLPGVEIYDPATGEECPRAEFDATGALANGDVAVGELVNIYGGGLFSGYYNDPGATDERLRDGKYWSGDLGYKDADDWIFLAGRTGDWLRVDGENLAAGPIERILQRLPALNRVAVYAVPDEVVGDAVMAAMVLNDDAVLTPEEFASFLAAQPDLSPKAWPSYVRIADDLPATATNKILKRQLKSEGTAVAGDTLWTRPARSSSYTPSTP